MSKAKDINMEVMEVHNLFWESYARRDIDLRFSLCSEDVTFIGSGLHERALNKTEYKSINKEGVKQFPNPFQIEFLWTNLSMLNEVVACVESEVVWSQLINDEVFKELLRNTTLLKRDNGKWLVTHVHGSVPDYRLKDGDYMTNEQTIIRNRELERQVFERTQDLNKTLEELEQKNRELEIEASLEKVRTIAMGMREPADMLDVCKTISLQLPSLGVKEIRNVQTAIFYEHRGTYMNYEFYAKHDKTFITETVFTNNKIHNDFATKMMRGKRETFITHIKGSKVKDWIAYQKTTNVFIDKYLETASSLNYYWFSLGPVALGISTYIPLTEDEINLFKRFLKVFELAYQRYLDIEQAIAQAREAKIEASLEKVRAAAMSMHKPDDLLNICEVSFNEFKKLGFDNLRNSLIHILDDEKDFFLDYDFSDSTGGKITKIFYKSHPIVENYLAQIRSAEDAFAEIVINGSQLNDWKDFRLKTGQQDDPRLNNIQALYYYGYSIGVGDITISTFKPIDESKIQILKRFRNVFDLAYRRYRDIALAEAQAREAQIELALERVRTRSMIMQKSDELSDAAQLLYQEFGTLGVNTFTCGYMFIDEIQNTQIAWMVLPDGTLLKNFVVFPLTGDHVLDSRYEDWKAQKPLHTYEIRREVNKEHHRFLSNHVPPFVVEEFFSKMPDPVVFHCANFSEGYLLILATELLSQEDQQTIIRFARVFEMTYTRFLDLQKAEAQAREAQIELALERVRARTMAMQKSDELKEVVASMFDGMKSLGVDPTVCNIALVDRKTCDTDVWTAHQTANGMITYKVFISHFEHPFRKKLLDSFLNEIPFSVHELSGDLKKSYAQYLFEHVDYSSVPAEVAKSNEELANMEDGIVLSAAYMKYGLLIVSRNHAISNDESDILQRFAKIFEQTYTRFLDLQRAEAQAREAKIEAALERVRSRSLAMHHSSELSAVVDTLLREFTNLEFTLTFCIINLIDEQDRSNTVWAANPETGKDPESYYMKFEDYPFHHAMWDAWKEQKKNFMYTIEGEEKKIYDEYLFTKTEFRRFPKHVQEANKALKRYVAGFTFFKYSGLQTVSENHISDEDLNILERFGRVFEQSYTRFLDLQKAEAQARESEIQLALERVRARTMAMQRSDELSETSFILFQQFSKLGIAPNRFFIGIMNEEEGNFDFWITEWGGEMYSQKFIVELDEPIMGKQLYKAWKAKNKSIVMDINGEDLVKWNEYLRSIDFPVATRNSVSRVVNSCAIFSKGAICITTPEITSIDTVQLLERFASVFDGTYTRFIDLKNAEEQARESQIETALERVRSKTMAMQKSEELKHVIRIVYEQFVHLKINVDHAGFVVDYAPKGDWHFWIADEQDIPSKITHPYFESVWANQFNEAKEKGADFFATNLNFEEKNKFYNELLSYVPGLPEASKDFYLSCPGLAATTVLFDNVSLYIENFSGTPYSDEENKILMRFGKVFQQTYTRFLDLQKAEAQAREANIETSLERVRSKAMAMHTTGDLSATVSAAFSELRKLGVETIRTGVALYSEDKPAPVFYASTTTEKDDALTIVGSHDPSSHTCLALQFDAWSQQQNYFPVLRGEELKSYYLALSLQPFLPKDNSEPFQHDEYGYYLPFSGGNFYVWSLKSCTENEISILSRFRAIIDLTFRRYFEIQNAEAQAREANIESSLERVRARAMSMHTPNDLSATVSLFFKELKSLNVLPWRCGVGRIDEETRTTYLTTTSITKDGDFTEVSGKLKQTGHPVLDGIFDHWKLQKEYYPVLRGDEINDYYSIIKPQIAYPDYPLDAVQYGHNIPFKEGFIFAWTENKLSEEELGIFRRFASVLSLTYRRYLDLKEAEERNRIIQAENDRKTKELEEARQLQLSMLPKKLPQLPNLDIAVYMKTATEVGGDYYDFNIQENGVLNIGFGDATGHGLQAGTMITLMKGFFTSDAARFSPPKFLENCNSLIRDIKLGRILMSFSHLRFENNSLLMSSAGMPPIYYHHKINNRTEEIIVQGLPLGALQSASYKLVEKQLNAGDTILLLTDGLPEQMNSHKVIFDYSRVLKYFDEIGDNSPQDIINRLVEKADGWMNGQQQTDDITFVVIKVK